VRVNYQYRAVEKFWRNFYKLSPEQKESVRRAWQIFKYDPFHPSLRSHEIHELSARAKHTIYSAVIEADLRVIFRIDDSWVTSLDVGTHKIYRQ
jgi:mRNA-degrading endonuclease YafQ of YafQ-DinJ toxin-antitoxin module